MSIRPPSSLRRKRTTPAPAPTPADNSASPCTRSPSPAITPAKPRKVTDAAIARAESSAIDHSTVTKITPRRGSLRFIALPFRLGGAGLHRRCCRQAPDGGVRSSAGRGSIGPDHEIGFAEQIGAGGTVSQNEPHVAWRPRFSGPALIPGQCAIRRHAPEYKRNVELALDQNDRIFQCHIFKARTRSGPCRATPDQSPDLVVFFDRPTDNVIVGAWP